MELYEITQKLFAQINNSEVNIVMTTENEEPTYIKVLSIYIKDAKPLLEYCRILEDNIREIHLHKIKSIEFKKPIIF
jgi:hypothetical protein